MLFFLYKKLFERGKYMLFFVNEQGTTVNMVNEPVNVGSTKAGINLDAVKILGKVIRECAEKTVDK